jgi:peptide/nickel transport system permease protein
VLHYLIQRTLATLPVALLVSFLVFGLIHIAPGDPTSFLVAQDASPEQIAQVREDWGLNDPFIVQYAKFLSNSISGNFGQSFRFSRPVTDLMLERLPATIELATLALFVALVVAIPLGVVAGWRPGSWSDMFGTLFGLFGVSMPSFWFGIMLILVLSGVIHLFPAAGRSTYGIAGDRITGFYALDSLLTGNLAGFVDAVRFMVLPAVTLGLGLAGILMRITRSSILEVSHEEYLTTARAKGLHERGVLWRHALANAVIPIITVVGLELGSLLSGSIIVETVFAWPGIGGLLVTGINARDYPLVTGIVLVYTVGFMLINLAVDLVYGVVDPRIKYTAG